MGTATVMVNEDGMSTGEEPVRKLRGWGQSAWVPWERRRMERRER